MTTYRVIGKPESRTDGLAKTTGTAKYGGRYA